MPRLITSTNTLSTFTCASQPATILLTVSLNCLHFQVSTKGLLLSRRFGRILKGHELLRFQRHRYPGNDKFNKLPAIHFFTSVPARVPRNAFPGTLSQKKQRRFLLVYTISWHAGIRGKNRKFRVKDFSMKSEIFWKSEIE